MYTGDDVIRVLSKYNYDLKRDDTDVPNFLKKHLESFFEDVQKAVEGNNPILGDEGKTVIFEKLNELKQICDFIPFVINEYRNGHILNSYINCVYFFNLHKDIFLFDHSRGPGAQYYRIRKGDYRINQGDDSKEKKKQLFHIPYNKCSNIGAYRYSIPGYPCLYLSTQPELAWFECGMPKEFSYCRMDYSSDNNISLELIDFAERPLVFLDDLITKIRYSTNDKLHEYYEKLSCYILSYPVSAACSMQVRNRDTSFVEEYIFPQLFMNWIRESDDIDGVIYKSSLDNRLANDLNAKNVALVVKGFRNDGLSQKLTDSLMISDIGFIRVSEVFKQYETKLSKIKEYEKILYDYMIENQAIASYIYEIIDAMEFVITSYWAVVSKEYTNPKLVFMHLTQGCRYSTLLFEKMEERIKSANEEAIELHMSFDADLAREKIEEARKLMSSVVTENHAFLLGFDRLDKFEYI